MPKYAGRSDDTGNEQVGLDILPCSITLDPRLCQPLLEQSDGIVGLEFLPEPDAGIDEQHDQDNGEVVPMSEHC